MESGPGLGPAAEDALSTNRIYGASLADIIIDVCPMSVWSLKYDLIVKTNSQSTSELLKKNEQDSLHKSESSTLYFVF
jgi:hypothetical protein